MNTFVPKPPTLEVLAACKVPADATQHLSFLNEHRHVGMKARH